MREAWARAQWGWPAAFPLVQFPNAPLAVGLLASLGAGATSGDAHDVLAALARVGFVAWASDELAHGVNWFRRLLGAGMLAYFVLAIAGVA